MKKLTIPFFLSVISLWLAGCGQKWEAVDLAGTQSVSIGFGHPEGHFSEVRPIRDGVYTTGHPIVIEGFAQGLFDDAPAENWGPQVDDFEIEIRRTDGMTWDGSSWGNVGFVSVCDVFTTLVCDQPEPEPDQPTDHFIVELLPEDLGEAEITVTIAATNQQDKTSNSATRTMDQRTITVLPGQYATSITTPLPSDVNVPPTEIQGTIVNGIELVELVITESIDPSLTWKEATTDFTNEDNRIQVYPDFDTLTWSWTFEENLGRGSGSYIVQSWGHAIDGFVESQPNESTVLVSTEQPETRIDNPVEGDRISSPTYDFIGHAEDDRHVDFVEILIEDVYRQEFWSANANPPAWSGPSPANEPWFRVPVVGDGSPFIWNWTWPQIGDEPGSGQFKVSVRATDLAGEQSPQPYPTANFFGPTDRVPPEAVIQFPAQGQILTAADLTTKISGIASDLHTGVGRVNLEILDAGNGDWYWSGSTWEPPVTSGSAPPVEFATDAGEAITWEYASWDIESALNAGGSLQYQIRANVYDLEDPPNIYTTPWIMFSIDPDVVTSP